MMIRFSAFADEVSQDFGEQLRYLSKEAVNFIEIRFVNGKNIMDLDESELQSVKKMLKTHGVKVSAIGSPIGKVSLTKPFKEHLELFRHAVHLAEYLDTRMIRIFSYYAPDGGHIDEFGDEVLDRMNQKIALLKGKDIIMVHENESHIYGHSAKNCVELASRVNSPHFRLAYDPANFVWGEDIVNNMQACWPLMKPWVIHVHIKDWKMGHKDIGSMPGEGDGQIPELLEALAGINYTGFLTMEPHLRSGGQFGGDTGPELFSKALDKTRQLCDQAKLSYRIRV